MIKKIKNQDKVKERKARTKRLIERGGILENLIPNATEFTNEEIQKFISGQQKCRYHYRQLRQHDFPWRQGKNHPQRFIRNPW
ncbi:MAG TPA: hypothetical protein DD421_04440 [Clostridiaceae bacterium]|nr:hypothetical protein [Clostridiaceae bacterium]